MALDELAFSLESFGWAEPDRLEVRGRWSGVRGRRFVRPVLRVTAGGRTHRLIAVLDHKPWSPDTADEWVASFPWPRSREGVGGAELELGSGLFVDLPEPGEDGPAVVRAHEPLGAATRAPRRSPAPAAPAEPEPEPEPEAAPPSRPRATRSRRRTSADGAVAAVAAPPPREAETELARLREAIGAERARHADEAAALRAQLLQARADVDAAREQAEAARAALAEAPDAAVLAELRERAEAAGESAARTQRELDAARSELEAARVELGRRQEHEDRAVERAEELVRLEGQLAQERERRQAVAVELEQVRRRLRHVEQDREAARAAASAHPATSGHGGATAVRVPTGGASARVVRTVPRSPPGPSERPTTASGVWTIRGLALLIVGCLLAALIIVVAAVV